MSGDTGLTEAFLSGAPPKLAPALRVLPQLEQRLGALLDQARQAHPSLRFEPTAFMRHLAARLPATGDAESSLSTIRVDELLLAFACAQGDAAALAALDTHVLSRVREWIPKEDASFVSEVQQRLRQRLLMPDGGNPPKISTFTGRGTLSQWARAVATRLAIDIKREATGNVPLDEAPADADALVGRDPEFSFIRSRYQEEFRHAFREALAALSPKERNLLRLHHVDNLSVDSVGTMYQTSRSTAARWIAQARERLLETTRSALADRLKLDAGELDSLLGLVRSHLDVSLHQLLKP
ncbi:MAG TPA: sigma-70 family RNA polymerase sigma factor [Myxococcaceae bacterium]|nr:sigma-70 family RNA polymerase sigma factor [Myxococcaceae bacterium]